MRILRQNTAMENPPYKVEGRNAGRKRTKKLEQKIVDKKNASSM